MWPRRKANIQEIVAGRLQQEAATREQIKAASDVIARVEERSATLMDVSDLMIMHNSGKANT